MNRFLEALFVLGCSLVGFAMSFDEGRVARQAAGYAVRLVAAHSEHLGAAENVVRMLGHGLL